jgi:NAD(P)-dependent dehydrogenase (short-subunit alcohol dehydrogenase family)
MTLAIDLSGKTALVTGSTRGIGAAIATRLAEAGAAVVVNGRSRSSVTQTARRLREIVPGSEITEVVADLSDSEGLAVLTGELPEVDVLINNLGIFEAVPPLEISDAEWVRYFEVNVLAGINLTRTYLPGMMSRGWGRVQYIASDSAVVTPAEMIHYGVSKTALLGVSRGFAKAAIGTGVTVNSVIAGPTHTEGVTDFVYQLVDKDLPWEEAQDEFFRQHRPQSLLRRFIQPEEIANLVTYLASPLASATTGAAPRVDGGYVDSILP